MISKYEDITPENFPEGYNFLSGAKEGNFCIINRNLDVIDWFKPSLGLVVKVLHKIPDEKFAIWEIEGFATVTDHPFFSNNKVLLVPDALLTPLVYTEGEDEMLKIVGKPSEVKSKELAEV